MDDFPFPLRSLLLYLLVRCDLLDISLVIYSLTCIFYSLCPLPLVSDFFFLDG